MVMVTAPESTEVFFRDLRASKVNAAGQLPSGLLPISSIKAEVILGVCS